MVEWFVLEPLFRIFYGTTFTEGRKEASNMFWLPVDRSLDLPLITQVYLEIRKRILQKHLKPGEKLPSTRALATELAVSRNVILEAYDQLLAEGFLITQQGAGTYVAEGAFLEQPRRTEKMPLLENQIQPIDKDMISFRSGVPALDFSPRKTWAKLAHNVWNEAPSEAFGYGMPEGRIELREAIANYLLKTRGVDCSPEQIIITSGATQALTLVAKLLLNQAATAIMEDPITEDIQTIFKTAGATIYPVPVDAYGMQTSLLPLHIDPKLIFLTPSHQFPIGGILPIQRRIQLIAYAREKDCYLIEDDYDSEFRYEGPPIRSLQGLAPERVLYIGSFSKILTPALRMGYLVLPPQLIENCRKLKWFSDLHTPALDQLILARFIAEGHLQRHIAKMKKIYKTRRDFLIRCLEKTFADRISIFGYSTGLHLMIAVKGIQLTKVVLERINKSGLEIYRAEDHAVVKGKHCDQLIIGFGHLSEALIEEGVKRLYMAIFHNDTNK